MASEKPDNCRFFRLSYSQRETLNTIGSMTTFSLFFGGITSLGLFSSAVQISGWAAAKAAIPVITLYGVAITASMMLMFGLLFAGANLIDRYYANQPNTATLKA